ncbi:182 kDa tankyrase-1-binding protein isoform X2 [Micropterus dolomieu]|uniref:182 kDa tankyrase-1-binding protein isoform X2 n=1 Tax=Micropterus dolomieu TaxID=147949 RepID=UPI001E8E06E0|nr:182 kDa tankyrase-1-binding protein isoform X2 [Micropterus dolomieu]
MESSVKGSLAGGTSKPKPALAPKPLLTPKPFSLQKNSTIRSIYAPRVVFAASKTTKEQAEKYEAGGVPKPTLTPPAQQPPKQPTTSDSKPSSVSAAAKHQSKTTKDSKAHGENILDSSVRKSEPAAQTAPPKETPTAEPIQKVSAIQTNHKAPVDIVANPEQKDRKTKEDETNNTSVVQKLEETGSEFSTANPANRWSGTRKRLPAELTSKFESSGLPLPPQPSITSYTTSAKDNTNKPESSDPEQSQTTAEPSNRECDAGGMKEDFGEGGSIKRRISLLFDSSSRPEVITKREEPEVINGTGGVKEKIKNWVTEKGPKTEKKPQVVPRMRSKSFEPATAPTVEKTPKRPPVEPPATGTSSSQAVDPPSKVSAAEQPTETPMETCKDALTGDTSLEISRETPGAHIQIKSTEGDVPLHNHIPSMSHTATDKEDVASSEIAQHAPKRDNVKRRSVRFGVVERDDGAPPIILGSPSDSSTEEEDNASEDEAEEAISVSVPVYRRVLQKKDDEAQEQEKRLKHLEFEKRRTEQIEQAKVQLEEERKRKEEEEEEREKEKARKKEEEDRESERLQEEEMERQRKEECERERLKEEERERERLREEEMERERRMELMRQRQREEERERAKQKEERLKQDLEEREKEKLKKKEEERKEERLREERERQRLREEEKTSSQGQAECRVEGKLGEAGMNKEEQKEEECGKKWVNKTDRLRGEEEEREKEKELELMWQRKKEEDGERARQKEERLRQEESEKERLREEAEEREKERQKRLEEQQKKEEEMERMRKLEKQREEERREEERRRQKERERVEELERKLQEERKRAQELEEERLRQEEREKERLREEAEEREKERQKRMQEQQKKEEEMERMRKLEKQREEERREEERKRQKERERVEELERKLQEERKRAQELEEKLRMEEERKRDGLTSREPESVVHEAEPNLISFDSEDVPLKSESLYPPLAKTHESTESQIEVLYDDFSVRPPLIDVDFDDFSVKPLRWGSQAKVQITPVIQSGVADPVKKEEMEVLVPVDVSRWENKVPEQVKKTDSPEPILAQESPEEEEEERPEDQQLISIEVEEEEMETEREEEEETQEDEVKEETKQAQVNSYCTNDENKDTVALIDDEPGQQNEACERTSGSDSPKPVPDQVPEGSSEDLDTTDLHWEEEIAPFPESSTPLLDTSAQKLKADLGKRRIRTRPSRSFRAGLCPTESPDWRTHDSTDKTEASTKQRESDSEEEQPKPKIVCSPPPTTQRVPMFPGLSPAALIAQLKRRTGGGGAGGGEEMEEDKARREEESQKEEVAPSPTQLPRSPRAPAHLAGAALVLPPLGGTDGGAVSSPAWLKELKSKKRLSQYDSET